MFSSPTKAVSRISSLAAVGAIALLAITATGTTITVPGIEIDVFASMVLVLVTAMGAIVTSYAQRSLRHEPYEDRFAAAAGGLVIAAALLAVTSDLLVLGAAWVGIGVAAVALLGTGPAHGRSQRTTRAKTAMAISDVAFLAAMAILVIGSGGTAIAGIGAVEETWATLAGVAVVIAAVARGATMPLHRWLTDSLGAPTPSSALLHAGVVNGGAIVAITLAPVTSGLLVPALLALVIGGLSCAVAEAVMLTRPDVKGRLAWSTTAQMSFTLVLCGLGLHTAAVLHLVAHGMFKGALFLGSGAGVRSLVRQRTAGHLSGAQPALARAGAAAVVVGAAGITLAAAGAPMTAEVLVPVGLATTAAACAAAAALPIVRTRTHGTLVLAASSGLLVVFIAATLAIKDQVEPAMSATPAALSAWPILAVLGALALIAHSRRHPPAPDTLGARAWLAARHLGSASVAPTRRPAATSPAPADDLAPALTTSFPRG